MKWHNYEFHQRGGLESGDYLGVKKGMPSVIWGCGCWQCGWGVQGKGGAREKMQHTIETSIVIRKYHILFFFIWLLVHTLWNECSLMDWTTDYESESFHH